MSVEFLKALILRRKCQPSVAHRLMRLNPHGVDEGSIPRGWHRKRTTSHFYWQANCRGVRGLPRELLARLPRDCFIRDGKRRYVMEQALR